LRETHLNRRAASEYEDYVYEALVGLDGRCASGAGEDELAELRMKLAQWVAGPWSLTDQLRKEIVRCCGWMYSALPDEVRTEVRLELRSYARAPLPSLSDSYLTAVGNGFVDTHDIRAFFQAFQSRVGAFPEGTNHWLRALRYLVQYREHALSTRAAPEQALRSVTEHVADRLAEQHREGNYHHIFNNCLHSLVFLLKRRRYDDGYLAPDADDRWGQHVYAGLHGTLAAVAGGGFRGRCNQTQRSWAEIVGRFLEMSASSDDLSKILKLVQALD